MPNQPVVYSEEEQSFVDQYRGKPFPELKNTNILRAAKGLKVDHVPTWLHRQAGRYLPEFLEVRREHPFFEVCRTPSIAAKVTLQPIDRFKCLDASIIFSDILVIPQALGIAVEMREREGPVVPNPIRTPEDLLRIDRSIPIDKALSYVYDAIMVTRHQLDGRVPLIGFCGAPFTLFGYMVEGGSSKTYIHTKTFLYKHPQHAKQLLQMITDACVEFLVGQARAGAQMLQVFESHGGELSHDMFYEFALPYLAQIPARVKKILREENITSQITQHNTVSGQIVDNADIPISVFPRMAGHSIPYLVTTQYDVISLDQTVSPRLARELSSQCLFNTYADMSQWYKPGVVSKTSHIDPLTHSVTFQGNLDPFALFADQPTLEAKVEQTVQDFGIDRYIFNLGHGMMPQHTPESVETLSSTVRRVSLELKAIDDNKY